MQRIQVAPRSLCSRHQAPCHKWNPRWARTRHGLVQTEQNPPGVTQHKKTLRAMWIKWQTEPNHTFFENCCKAARQSTFGIIQKKILWNYINVPNIITWLGSSKKKHYSMHCLYSFNIYKITEYQELKAYNTVKLHFKMLTFKFYQQNDTTVRHDQKYCKRIFSQLFKSKQVKSIFILTNFQKTQSYTCTTSKCLNNTRAKHSRKSVGHKSDSTTTTRLSFGLISRYLKK